MSYIGKTLAEIPFEAITSGMKIACKGNNSWRAVVVEARRVSKQFHPDFPRRLTEVKIIHNEMNSCIYDFSYKDYIVVETAEVPSLSLSKEDLKQAAQEQQLRYALHSLRKIAEGQEDPAKFAEIAIKHITGGDALQIDPPLIFLNQSEAEAAYTSMMRKATQLHTLLGAFLNSNDGKNK